jgi:hypothetical protein
MKRQVVLCLTHWQQASRCGWQGFWLVFGRWSVRLSAKTPEIKTLFRGFVQSSMKVSLRLWNYAASISFQIIIHHSVITCENSLELCNRPHSGLRTVDDRLQRHQLKSQIDRVKWRPAVCNLPTVTRPSLETGSFSRALVRMHIRPSLVSFLHDSITDSSQVPCDWTSCH